MGALGRVNRSGKAAVEHDTWGQIIKVERPVQEASVHRRSQKHILRGLYVTIDRYDGSPGMVHF